MAKDDAHFRLRLPADLKAKIEKAAVANNRSANAEIVSRLEMSLETAGTWEEALETINELWKKVEKLETEVSYLNETAFPLRGSQYD